jgi:hypothetical protein
LWPGLDPIWIAPGRGTATHIGHSQTARPRHTGFSREQERSRPAPAGHPHPRTTYYLYLFSFMEKIYM